MLDSGLPVFESVGDALFQDLGNLYLGVPRNIFTDHISAQRERKSGYRFPPKAKVKSQFKTLIGVGDLTFMNDESDVRLAGLHGVKNLVKWNRDNVYFRGEQT